MSQVFHILGDGIAGLSAASALVAAGHDVVVHGDGANLDAQARALVHRHAGRSFRTDAVEDAAWEAATPALREFVERGAAMEIEMLRPVSSRLERSVEHAVDVENIGRETHPDYGEVFRYGPAYSIGIGPALGVLKERLVGMGVSFEGRSDPRTSSPSILAVGAALPRYVERLELQLQGGDLVTYEGTIDHAVSGRGFHAVPADDGVCVGSTWWDPEDPDPVADSATSLRESAEGGGLQLGEVRAAWRGVRCIHPDDRRPLVGRVADDCWVVGALGTRGWLWSPLLAEEVLTGIEGGTVRDELDIARTPARLRD